MTLLVAAVIVHDRANGRILLLRRSANGKFGQNMWDLPGGKSEPGEPVTRTAVRELWEETGLGVRDESLEVAHVIHGAWGVEAPDGFLTVVFVTDEWHGRAENREPGKHSEVRWVDIGALPTPFVKSTDNALRAYFARKGTVTLRGWD